MEIHMSSQKTAAWIKYFGAFLDAFCLVAGAIGIFNPEMFFNDFPAFTQCHDIAFITTGWSVRGLAAGVACLLH
jgi:hypothetical protein